MPLLVLALMLAGCGGDGNLSAAEYRQKADAICAKANAELKAIPQPQSPAQIDYFVEQAKPVVQDAVDDLQDLNAPAELDGAAHRWNDQNRRAIEELDELKGANATEIEDKADEFARINNEANRIARDELGLRDCAED